MELLAWLHREFGPWWWLGLLAVNLIAFLQAAFDKRRARTGGRRLSERRLVAPVVLGGLPGLWLAMLCFRHKTQKRSFHAKVVVSGLGFVGLWWLLNRWCAGTIP